MPHAATSHANPPRLTLLAHAEGSRRPACHRALCPRTPQPHDDVGRAWAYAPPRELCPLLTFAAARLDASLSVAAGTHSRPAHSRRPLANKGSAHYTATQPLCNATTRPTTLFSITSRNFLPRVRILLVHPATDLHRPPLRPPTYSGPSAAPASPAPPVSTSGCIPSHSGKFSSSMIASASPPSSARCAAQLA